MLWFELKYHFSQVTFRIAFLLFFLLGFITTNLNFGTEEVHKNAPYVISTMVGLLALFSIFVATLFCANVVLRDTTYNMDSLLFSTGIKRLPYFTVRILGLVISVFLILAVAVMGLFSAAVFQDPARLGPFKPEYFLQPLFALALPTVVLVSSLLFSVAILSRNVKLVYVSGVLLYVLYLLGSILGNSPLIANAALKLSTPNLLTVLADPFGLAPFFQETRSWTTAQRNEQLFALKGDFLLNRLAWTSIALLLLAMSYHYFKFRASCLSKSKNPGKRTTETFTRVWYRKHQVGPFGNRYYWAILRQQVKLESAAVFKHLPFFLMLLIGAFLMTIELKDHLFSGSYGIQSYPVAETIITQLMAVRPAMLLIVFYTSELICRERSVNIQTLIYSSPAPNLIFWAAKALSLGLMVMAIISLNIGIGVATQLFNGQFWIDLPAYLSLYYYSGLPLFLFALLAVFIQTLIPNKYLGMMLNLFVAGLISFSRSIGIEHYLLRYASVPAMEYAKMNGFGHYAMAFNWYMLYWTAFALLLAFPTISRWQNGRAQRFGEVLKSAGKHWTKTGRLVFFLSLGVWVGSGAYIYRQTNIIGKYKSRKAQLEWQLGYEKKYKTLDGLPQPVIKTVKTQITLYPEDQQYTLTGSYLIKNESLKPISTIWLNIDQEVNNASLHIAGATKQVHDKKFDQYRFSLKQPLLPGASLRMQFSMEVIRSGFTPFNNENSLLKNGSYVELEKYLPSLGYNSDNESDDAIARKKAGLPALRSMAPSPDQPYHLIDYESTISTLPDQYVLSVGTLQRSWTANRRRYFHYKTEKPINFMLAFSSAKYSQTKALHNGMELNIFYQEGHEYNVPAILQGMKDALDYGNKHFGPYPSKQLSFAEIPQYRAAATAYPGLLFGPEKTIFLGDYRNTAKVNYAYATTAHETAHQWWAHQLAPANAPSAALLTESLAKYTEARVLEHRFGKAQLSAYLKADNLLYFNLRNGSAEELPLIKTVDQSFVHYQKGGLNLYAVSEAIGEARFNGALRRLLVKHSAPKKMALAEDLMQELYVGASASQKQFIDEALRKVITYSLKIRTLSCQPLKDGRYRVTIQVNIHKTDWQAREQKPLAVNEDFDIAFFDRQTEGLYQTPNPFYLQKHHFNKEETIMTLVLNKKPKATGIDPYGYVLDEDQRDNIQVVK